MKSTAKVPFKNKKTPYNLNEVDVNLLLKNPSSIRKVVKGNKEEHYHDDEENEEKEGGAILPPLAKGQELFLKEMQATERYSRPPARYTEASLVK